VVLGLHSDWTALGRWLGGAATIALCCVVAHACTAIAAKDSSFRTLAVNLGGTPTVPERATSQTS
jgi:hypothetical protein